MNAAPRDLIRSTRFRQEREADWRRLETVVDRAEREGDVHQPPLRVGQDVFTPGVLAELHQESHDYARASPLMARFTRFRLSGIL